MHNGFLGPSRFTYRLRRIKEASGRSHIIRDEALVLFGKRKGFDDAVREKYLFREAKVFSGNLVKEWTGIWYWVDVKTVTDTMRVWVLVGIYDGNRDRREEMKRGGRWR